MHRETRPSQNRLASESRQARRYASRRGGWDQVVVVPREVSRPCCHRARHAGWPAKASMPRMQHGPPRAGCRVSHGRSSAGQSDGHRLEACRWWGRWTRMAGPQKGKWLGRRSDPFGPLANNAGCGSAPEKRLWPITHPAPRCLRRDSRLIDAHRFAAGACRRDVYKSDFTTLAAVYKAPPGALLRDVWGVIFAQLPLPKQAGLEFSDLL